MLLQRFDDLETFTMLTLVLQCPPLIPLKKGKPKVL